MKLLKKIIIFLLLLIIFALIGSLGLKNYVYSKPYSDIVQDVSRKYDIDENLIYAMIKVESNFQPNAISRAQAKGLMQIIDETAVEISNRLKIEDFTVDMLYDPKINIEIGTKYFSTLLNKYENNEILALIAYNAGQGNLDKWISDGKVKGEESYTNLPYAETTVYWQKVMREYNVYNKLYE